MYAAGGPIVWQSKLQSTVAVSTMEAEYMAAFGAIQELIWIKGVLGENSRVKQFIRRSPVDMAKRERAHGGCLGVKRR